MAGQPPPAEEVLLYTAELEKMFSEEGERAQGLAWLHYQAAEIFLKKNTRLALPIIVLSTLAGTASTASTSLFPNPQIANVCVGALSIFVGILGTVQAYLRYSQLAETHRMTSISYAKLNKFIQVEMTLNRKDRIRAADLLKMVRDQLERLLETAPPIPPPIVAEFKIRFKDSVANVALPDITNGLRSIKAATPQVVEEQGDIQESRIKVTLV